MKERAKRQYKQIQSQQVPKRYPEDYIGEFSDLYSLKPIANDFVTLDFISFWGFFFTGDLRMIEPSL